jgi:hypothetical protein
VVTRFFCPPDIPRCIASPTRISAHISSPKIYKKEEKQGNPQDKGTHPGWNCCPSNLHWESQSICIRKAQNGYIHITTHMTLNQQILLQPPPLLLISVMYEETVLYGVVLITGGVTVSGPSLCNLLQCYSPYPPLQLPASNLTNVMMQTLFTQGCEPARQRKKKKKKQHCCHSWLFLVRMYVLCTEKKEFMGYPFFTPFQLSFITEMVEIWHLHEELQVQASMDIHKYYLM